MKSSRILFFVLGIATALGLGNYYISRVNVVWRKREYKICTEQSCTGQSSKVAFLNNPAAYWNDLDLSLETNIAQVVFNENEVIPRCHDHLSDVTLSQRSNSSIVLRSVKDIILHGGEAFRVSVLQVPIARIRDAYGDRHQSFFRNNSEKTIPTTSSPNDNIDEACALRDELPDYIQSPLNLSFMLPTLACAKNAQITSEGQIANGPYSLMQDGHCKAFVFGEVPTEHSPMYEKAFVISQYWGDQFYHALAEDLPRLAYYYEYLLQHNDIVIVTRSAGFPHALLEFLGFERDRMASGAVQAKYVYVPEPSVECGYPNVLGLLKLRDIFYQRIQNLYPEVDLKISTSNRKTIVLIKRSRGRWLANHDSLKRALEFHFPDSELIEFSDQDVPTFEQIQKIFYQASVVIGPHGAGFTNIISCRPGTLIIEHHGDSPNFCYRTQAEILGLKYYGILSDPRSKLYGSIWADIDDSVCEIKRHFTTLY